MARLHWIFALVLMLLSQPQGYGDLPTGFFPKVRPAPRRPVVPDQPPIKMSSKLILECDASAKEVRIILPLGGLQSSGWQSHGEPRGGTAQARTWVAGVALSCAVLVTGLLICRGKRKPGRALQFASIPGMSLLLVGCGLFSEFVHGPAPITSSKTILIGQGYANVESTPDIGQANTEEDRSVRVVLPSELATKINKEKKDVP